MERTNWKSGSWCLAAIAMLFWNTSCSRETGTDTTPADGTSSPRAWTVERDGDSAVLTMGVTTDEGTGDATGWTRYRGPNGSGRAAASPVSPPTRWSETENMKWMTTLPGPGSSSPIVSGDSVFVTCYSGYGVDKQDTGEYSALRRHLLRINREDGSVVWDKTVAAASQEDGYRGFLTEHGYASHTPVTDGERVYAFFGKSGVVAYDLDGNAIWRKNVGNLSSRKHWGSAASPILYKNLLIVNASDESRTLFAFDKMTGEEIWKVESDKLEYSYATPALAVLPDGRQELIVAVPYEVWGFDPGTGVCHWWSVNELGNNVAPSVLVEGDVAYLNGGYPRIGSIAVRAGGSEDTTDTHLLWEGELGSYIPTPVAFEGHLYGVTERGLAYGVDAQTGQAIFEEELPVRGAKAFYASVVLVDKKILAVSRQAGTFVFEAAPGFRQLQLNVIAGDESDFNATPAVAGGAIYLRSNKVLYCIAGVEG